MRHALSILLLLACITAPSIAQDTMPPADPNTSVIEQCGKVCEKLSVPATVTFQRRQGAWLIKEVSLHYDVSGKPVSADADLLRLATLPSIESISISGSHGTYDCQLTEQGLKNLLPLQHLRRLSLFRLSGNLDLQSLTGFPELEELDLSGVSEKYATKDLPHLKDLPNLRKLNLSGRDLTDAALDNIQPLTNLQSLNLDQNLSVTNVGLARLKGLTNLRELSLSGVNFTGAGLANLKDLPQLQVLKLYPYSLNTRSANQITGKSLQSLKNLTKLRELTIDALDASGDDLLALKGLTKLEHLTLDGKIKNAGDTVDFSFLTNLKVFTFFLDVGNAEIVFPEKLERAEFSVEQTRWRSNQPAISQRPQVMLATELQEETETLPRLGALDNPLELQLQYIGDEQAQAAIPLLPRNTRRLKLDACSARPFTNAGMKELAKFDQLESLELPQWCPGQITEAGIAHLLPLKNLRHLHISNVTAEAFARIADLKELRTLTISGVYKKDARPTIDHTFPQWRNLEKLERLSINYITLTDEGLGTLTPLKNLHTLDLSQCTGFSNHDLALLLRALPNLQTITRTYQPSAPVTTQPTK